MQIHRLILVCCLGLLLAPAARSDQSPTYPAYGEGMDFLASGSAVLLTDEALYMTWPAIPAKTNRCLVAVDASRPDAPKLLARLELDGFPQGLARIGTHVLVVNGLDLIVVEAADPAALKIAARLTLAEDPLLGPQGIDVKGTTAFLACRKAGVVSVNLSNPLDPKIEQNCKLPGFARSVAVAGDHLVVALDNQGAQILAIDANNKLKPISSLPAATGSMARVLAREQTAFFAAGETLLACVSLAEPDKLAMLGTTSSRSLLSPYYGGYAYDVAWLDTANADAAEERKFVCVADGECGLIVADVTEPKAPRFYSGFLSGSRGFLTSLAIRKNIAFVNDELFGLRVVDLSNPAQPVWLGAGLKLAP